MKKLIIGVMSLILLLSLCACQDNSLILETQDKIEVIGEVTLESETAIISAETAYNELEDAQKEKVDNYADLTSARTVYDELKKAEDERLAEQERLEEQERLAPIQEFAGKFLITCSQKFKNPLTLEIIDVWYYYDTILKNHYFTYEFEVENGYGTPVKSFYGNDVTGFDDLTDEWIEREKESIIYGHSWNFKEDGLTAMQKGEKIDGAFIQEYFLKNYK